MGDRQAYAWGVLIVGGVTFVGCLIYAVSEYGWLYGMSLGFLAAIFTGVLAGFLWPLILFGVCVTFCIVILLNKYTNS